MMRKRVTVSLLPWQLKKLDTMARRYWPSLNPKKCRGSVIRCMLNYVDARTYVPRWPELRIKRRKKSNGKQT